MEDSTMLKKVVYVAVLMNDQDKALDFDTNVVGLEKRGDYPHANSPRFLTVGVKGAGLRARSLAGHTSEGRGRFRRLHDRAGEYPDCVRDTEVARSEVRAT
jgi:hypothetical protein